MSSDIVFKLVVIGERGVGKTALIRKFINGEYTKLYKPTTKEEQFARNITLRTHTYSLKITNTGSEDTCRDKTITKADRFILGYDICVASTFEKIPQLYKKIQKAKALVRDNPVVIIVRNKLDRFNKRKVSREKAEKEARRLNCGYTEVAAKGSVDDVFFSIIECIRSSSSCNDMASEDRNWFTCFSLF